MSMFNLKTTFSILALSAGLLAAPMVANANDASAISVSPAKQHKAGAKGSHHGWKQLKLSDEQKDKIFELRHAQAPVLRELHKDVKAARGELKTLSQADSFDESKAKEASDKLARAQADIALNRAQQHSQLNAVLTPEQRKQLSELHSQRGKRGGPAKARHHGTRS
ncbi:Spy/CpxP family protein refolding chaperone [Paenalcaligenes niemegkensis]|uniref:Spy/CpxP family protein refolding chaperone n=1 Tax=Paenalcaligenes niemegkensis TaxID=2895469 RepID=UPI001EE8B90C|nr:Spy/CpxP family protein refolding chaperone [Paenalcaligenes niemegkensis]MCQ9616024.1 Spy/CpxP family protein refolding chaperone [Paenalcaligenes niemegkensis]